MMATVAPLRSNPLSFKEMATVALVIFWLLLVVYALLAWGWWAWIAIPLFTLLVGGTLFMMYFGKYVIEAALL